MVIKFVCPGCSKHYSVPDGMAGKRANCPCGIKIPVPAPGPTTGAAVGELDGDPLAVGAAVGELDGDPLGVGNASAAPAAETTAAPAAATITAAVDPLRGAAAGGEQVAPSWGGTPATKGTTFSKKTFILSCVGCALGGLVLGILIMMLFGGSKKTTSTGTNNSQVQNQQKPDGNSQNIGANQQVSGQAQQNSAQGVQKVDPNSQAPEVAYLATPEELGDLYLAALKTAERSQSEALSALMIAIPSDADWARLTETMRAHATTDADKEGCDTLVRQLTKYFAQSLTSTKRNLEEISAGINGSTVPVKWNEARLVATISSYDPETAEFRDRYGVKMLDDSAWVFVVFEAGGDRFGLLIKEVFLLEGKWYVGDDKCRADRLGDFAGVLGIKERFEQKNDPALSTIIRDLQ